MSVLSQSESNFLEKIIKNPEVNVEKVVSLIKNKIQEFTSELESSEKKLKESEKRYRFFLENFQGIAYHSDMDFKPFFFLGAVENITGYSEEDFKKGQPRWDEIIVPEDKEKISETSMKIHNEPNYSIDREYRILRKDGQLRRIHEQIQNICDTNNKIFRVQGVLFDVTERMNTQEKLKESEERFKYLVSSNPAVIYTSKVTGDFGATFISDNTVRLWGFESKNFMENSEFWLDHVHPDDKEPVLSILSELGDKDHIIYDYRFKIRDDTYRWMRDEVFLVRDDGGNPKETIGSVIDITDRKIAEQKMRYQADLVANVSDAIISSDLNFNIISWNKAAEKIYGWNEESVLGKNVDDIIPVTYILTDSEIVLKEFRENGFWSGEVIQPHKNGRTINISSSVSTIKDFEGNPIGVVAINRDITDRKISELKLKESEEKYRILFNEAPFGIFLFKPDGTILDFNTAIERISGYKKTELMGRNFKEIGLYHDPTKTSVEERQALISQGKDLGVREIQLYRKNGELFWASSNVTVIQLGKESVVQAIIQDITKSKIVEEKLKESERTYRGFVNNISDIIYEIDIKGICSYVSHQLFAISGFLPEEMIGQNVIKFVHPDDLLEVAEEIKIAFSSEDNRYNEFRLRHKDGHYVHVSTRFNTIYVGEKQKLTGVLVDITESKQVEQKLKESEENFRLMAEQAVVGIFITQNYKFPYVNHKLAEITGYSVEEMLSWKPNELFKLFHPDDLDFVKEQGEKKLRGDPTASKHYQYRCIRKNGEIIWIDQYSKKSQYQGRTAILGIILDITDKMEAEQKLKESEKKYRSLFENSPITLMNQDFSEMKKYIDNLKASGINDFKKYFDDKPDELLKIIFKPIIVEVNKKAIEVYKAKSKEDFFSNVNQLSENVDHTLTEEAFLYNKLQILSLINGETTYDSEIETQTFQGDTIHLYIKTSIASGFESTWSNAIVSIIDITERKEAEQNLKKSEEKYRSLVEDAQEGIWALDENENTTFVNPRICEMLGYTKDEMMGKNLHLLIPDSMKERIKGNRIKREKGVKETYDLELIKKDGAIIYTKIRAAPVMNESRDYKGSFAYITDITLQKQAEDTLRESEESLKQINIELEKRVEERTTGLLKSERKFKSIFMDSPIGIELYDSSGKLTEANKACCDIFGVSNSRELEGFDLFNDPNIPKYEMEKLKNGKIIRYEAKFDFDKVKQFNLYNTSKSGKSYLDVMITPLYIEDKQEISNYLVQVQDITERQNIEAELRNIFNLSLIMIGSSGNDAFFKRINPAVGKTLGYTDEELLSKSFIELVHPDDVESTLKEVETLSEGKSTVDFVNRYRCKNDFYKWIEWNVKPIPEEEINYFVAQDVTARKVNEIKLKEYAEKLEFMVEERTRSLKTAMEKADLYLNRVEVIIVALDTDGKITMLNKKGYSLLGYEEGKLVGKDWFEMCLPKQNRKDVSEVFKKLMRNELETAEFNENPILTKNGEEKIIAWRNTLLLDNKGEIIGTLAAGVDITERRKTQKKLIESEKKYRALFENTPIGVTLSDYRGNIIDINEHMKKLFGYELKELQKLGVVTTYANDQDRIPFKKQLEEQGYIQEYEVDLKKKDGIVFPALVNSIKTTISGEPIYINTIRDISEKKEMEEIKTHLLKRFSHEFKTPLISIKGFSDLLLSEYKHKLDEKTISFLERIKEGANRLNVLINAFMQTSQLGERLTNLNKDKANFSDLIKRGVSEMEGLINLRRHTINLDIPEELIGEFDKEKIYTVLTNLLMNAINYTPPEGKIFIHSKIEVGDIFFSINDSGIGLMKEDKRHLFKSFGKIEKFGKGWDIVSEGMGIGLYLSKEIISLHGGKIWAESEGRNKGSTFFFSLPIT